jgi:hypothetical protein
MCTAGCGDSDAGKAAVCGGAGERVQTVHPRRGEGGGGGRGGGRRDGGREAGQVPRHPRRSGEAHGEAGQVGFIISLVFCSVSDLDPGSGAFLTPGPGS